MRIGTVRQAILAGLWITAAGCADAMLPLAEGRVPNLTTAAEPDGEQQTPACCDPVIVVVPGPDVCDPSQSLDWCEGSGGECMTSQPGADGAEYQGTSGCDDEPGTGPGGDTPPPPRGEPPPNEPPDTCNTGEPLVDAPDVSGRFSDLWLESVLKGVEKGGWIVASGGTYRLVPFQNAAYSACGIDIYESPPPGTVSMLHTHPWPLFTVTPCGYVNTGTPSQEDIQALQLTGLSTGYFLDEHGIGRFTANGGDQAYRIGRCGY
jgi:hypothetical protein